MLSAAHTVRSLHYRLISGEVALEPLHILKTQDLIWHDWHVRFVVLGASHAVQLTRGETIFTELLTCLPPVTESTALYESTLQSCHEERLILDGLCWDVRLWVCDWAEEEADAFSASTSHLEVAFPALESAETPITRIEWHLRNETLCIETLHTYPNEGRSVRSHTQIAPKQTVLQKEKPE